MKVSIVISVYESYEAVRRQMRYFAKLGLQDVEVIIVDDGSEPPIPGAAYRTGNRLAWTQGLGRNLGASHAQGEYLLFTDIDHILSAEAIQDVKAFTSERMMFPRYLGVLLQDGTLSQDPVVLAEYGAVIGRRGLYASVHQNTFGIKRASFEALGGYDPSHSLMGYHPLTKGGDEVNFNVKWKHWAAKNGVGIAMGSPIYMFPVGRFHVRGETNPMGLFHNLSYVPVKAMKGQEHG